MRLSFSKVKLENVLHLSENPICNWLSVSLLTDFIKRSKGLVKEILIASHTDGDLFPYIEMDKKKIYIYI